MVGKKSIDKELDSMVRELEEALKLIREKNIKSIFLAFSGNVFIEVDKDFALEYVENRLSTLKNFLKRRSGEK